MSDELNGTSILLRPFVAIILNSHRLSVCDLLIGYRRSGKAHVVYFLSYILRCSVSHVFMHYLIRNDLILYILLISIISYTYYGYRCIYTDTRYAMAVLSHAGVGVTSSTLFFLGLLLLCVLVLLFSLLRVLLAALILLLGLTSVLLALVLLTLVFLAFVLLLTTASPLLLVVLHALRTLVLLFTLLLVLLFGLLLLFLFLLLLLILFLLDILQPQEAFIVLDDRNVTLDLAFDSAFASLSHILDPVKSGKGRDSASVVLKVLSVRIKVGTRTSTVDTRAGKSTNDGETDYDREVESVSRVPTGCPASAASSLIGSPHRSETTPLGSKGNTVAQKGSGPGEEDRGGTEGETESTFFTTEFGKFHTPVNGTEEGEEDGTVRDLDMLHEMEVLKDVGELSPRAI